MVVTLAPDHKVLILVLVCKEVPRPKNNAVRLTNLKIFCSLTDT